MQNSDFHFAEVNAVNMFAGFSLYSASLISCFFLFEKKSREYVLMAGAKTSPQFEENCVFVLFSNIKNINQ